MTGVATLGEDRFLSASVSTIYPTQLRLAADRHCAAMASLQKLQIVCIQVAQDGGFTYAIKS